ncbi:hypothetical protein [Cytobacillus oceanisediminis]|uniref:hypothetical protein n=1 Tax=Cytobacillus oceanisediminis TaxID=665099 RepID=UPI00254C050B|nr:hypothetical protein [Cytobacillus oceanisediminis]MDK7664385.1 hypothetical protein [Cytobacillus oceanisediminis]
MPKVLDATVANASYQTSASTEPIKLDNGTFVAAARMTSAWKLYKSTNGVDWSEITTATAIAGEALTLSTDGVNIFVINYNFASYYPMLSVFDESGFRKQYIQLDSQAWIQNQVGSGTSIYNPADKSLHVAWSCKNGTYNSSLNIKYTKVNFDNSGVPALGAVEQVTIQNVTTSEITSPSLVVINGEAIIFASFKQNSNYYIMALKKTGLTTAPNSNANWSHSFIYGVGYAQSLPQARFVPQSVNGLANGRIWVVWQGKEVGNSNDRSRYSYSDNGGMTWSPMTLVSDLSISNYGRPTITVNKNNDVFVISDYIDTATIGVRRMRNGENSFSSWQTYSNTGNYPSALYDPTLNFTEPLFIYKGTAKVGFKGTWVVTNISVPQGSLGQVSDKNNLLTYSITTDGTMGPITEKVNGVTVGTKTATSGQSLTVGLTQEQWDAIRFGKYADATGVQNILTIEMGSEKWTYTFNKMPAADADLISVAKVFKDYAETVDPARRALMAAVIRSKGGNALDSADWETMVQAVEGIQARKKASGTVTSDALNTTYTYSNGTTGGFPSAVVTGLGFKPTKITLKAYVGGIEYIVLYEEMGGGLYPKLAKISTFNASAYSTSTYNLKADVSPASVVYGSFKLPVLGGYTYAWEAEGE